MNPDVNRRREARVLNAKQRAHKAEKIRLEGNNVFVKGDFLAAAAKYLDALEVDGPRPMVLSNLAACYNALERHSEADNVATTALEYDPRHVKARYRRALARKKLGHYRAALKDLNSVLSLDPSHSDAPKEIALIKYMQASNQDFSCPEDDHPLAAADAWEIPEDSDTEDCKHHKEAPCAAYNRGSCKAGRTCQYSHGPDTMSVRDELGKNVCSLFLLGICGQGSRCDYSHSKTNLPSGGWWNNKQAIADAKKVKDWLDDEDAEYHEIHPQLVKHPKANGFAARREWAELSLHLHSQYESIVEAGRIAKENKFPGAPAEDFILVVSLDYHRGEYDPDAALLASIARKIKVVDTGKSSNRRGPEMAIEHLDSPHLVAVLLIDAYVVTKPEHAKVAQKLVTYAKNGGNVVMGGQLPSHLRPDDFNRAMKGTWGLNWKSGSYHRSTFQVNTAHDVAKRTPSLAKSYSMKALHVANIQSKDAIYADSQPTREAPVVSTKLGKGYVGYVGDVNGEVSSEIVTMAMLGVLDRLRPSSTPKPAQKESKSATSGPSQDGAASAPKLVDKFVLILTLGGPSDQQKQKLEAQVAELSKRITTKTAESARKALEYMADASLHGIYVADHGIVDRLNVAVLLNLNEYAQHGGLVVFGGLFPIAKARPDDILRVFSTFGLPWIAGSHSSCVAELNERHETAGRNPELNNEYKMAALHLSEHRIKDLLYENAGLSEDEWEAPILRARVGQGRVGYIGDTNFEAGSTAVLLSMLELLSPNEGGAENLNKALLLICDFDEEDLDLVAPEFIEATEAKVQVLVGPHSLDRSRMLELLASPNDLVGVVVGDGSLLFPENAMLLSRLVDYTKNGGTVVCCWNFGKEMAMRKQLIGMFFARWGLQWDLAGPSAANTKFSANPANVLFKDDAADHPDDSFSCKGAVFIKGITEAMAAYIPVEQPKIWNPSRKVYSTPFVFAEVGKGRVGYVGFGDITGDIQKVIHKMVGLL